MKINIGAKIRILVTRAKNTWWEYGYIVEIKGNEALINYGTPRYPVYGLGIWMPLSEIEVMEEGGAEESCIHL